jgi:hypothetical protein
MSLHINRFVDSIKAHEARGQRDFTMSLRDAKDLHADITKLLLIVHELQLQSSSSHAPPATTSMELHGGTF